MAECRSHTLGGRVDMTCLHNPKKTPFRNLALTYYPASSALIETKLEWKHQFWGERSVNCSRYNPTLIGR